MITKFNCDCGNTNPKKAKEYDGALGYEAIVCTVCGIYYDESGTHKPDEWSKKFIKREKFEYNILSPDGFTITPDNYKSKALANKTFTLWRKRYEKQGYYSSTNGRIALNQLKHECQMITINNGNIIDRYYIL